jgi:hypothetical protein
MSERDAFGREKGEDSLAEMGWSWSTDAPATPTPTPTPAPATPEPAFTAAPAPPPTNPPAMSAGAPAGPAWTPGPPAMVRLRRRRRMRGIMVPLLVIGVALVAVGGVTSVLQAGSDAFDEIESAVRDATADAVPTAVAPAPTGVESGSLLRPAALKAALAKLPSKQVQTLRVAPERIDAQVYVGGKMHVVRVRSDGGVSDVPTPLSGGGKRSRVDASAPNRIVRTAAKRAGRSPSRVSYLVLLGNEWQLFFDDGLHYSASANGRKVRRIG